MTGLSIGSTLPGAFATGRYAPADFAAAAAILDEAFDIAWTGDHLLWHYPILDPIVTLSSAALVTERVRLGTGILHVPIRPVLQTAKSLASLDYLSGGRLVVGAGVGGENDREFDAVGVPVTERGARTDEALQAFRALWRDERASFHGRFCSFDDVELLPRPVQPGGPPIWVGGRTPAALRRAARHDGWLALFMSPDAIRRNLATIAELRDGRPFEAAIHLPACVGGAEARERFARFYGHQPDTPPERFARYWVTGSPAEIVDTVGRYVDAGIRHVVLAPPGPEFVAQLETLATDVVGELRRAFGPAGEVGR
jgi:probable F420-dependent oxidoreductase